MLNILESLCGHPGRCKKDTGVEKRALWMLDDTKVIRPDLKGDQTTTHTPGQDIPANDHEVLGTKLKNPSRTDKQRQASAINGRNSHGPTSLAGKQKAAQNAVRDGIFSRRIVIEQLGETREDFEQLKRAYFDYLQPSGALEEQFVTDLTENSFLRERARRGEEDERRNHLETFQSEYDLRRTDQLDILRARFIEQLETYVRSCDPTCGRLPHELDAARRDLMSMSEGVDFLLMLLEEIKAAFERSGMLTEKYSALFQAIRGSSHPLDIRNRIEHLTMDNDSTAPSSTGAPVQEEISHSTHDLAKHDKSPSEIKSDPVTAGLAAFISSVAEWLHDRKRKLERIEEGQIQKEIALIMLDPSPSERFSRAETARERKMYRALGGLAGVRALAPSPSLSGASRDKIAKRTREFRMREPGTGMIESTAIGDLATPHSEVTSNGPPPS